MPKRQQPTNQPPKGTFEGKPSEEIAYLLEMLDALPDAQNRRVIRAWLSDELTRRHPEVADATDRWARDTDDERTQTEVILDSLPAEVRNRMAKRVTDD
jgi:hypothetical protein